MKKKLLSVLCFVVVLVLAGTVGTFIGKGIYQLRYFSSLPEYAPPTAVKSNQYCPLCEKVPTNGPLMVDTNSGRVGEIQIFDTELQNRLKISEKRDYGCMRMGGSGYCTVYTFPDNCYADVSIQRDNLSKYSKDAAELYYCEKCVENFDLLDPDCNYVVVDGYDRENLQYFNLRDIEKVGLTIRHYTFEFKEKNEYRFAFRVVSNYFDGGRELDYLNE